MTSIIIPAHNEEAVIATTLSTLMAGLDSGTTEILVVCNGCDDQTATEARRVGGSVRVIEIEQASKIAALNADDAAAQSYPRVYLDADVEIDGSSIRRLVEELRRPGVAAVQPVPQIEPRHSTLPVKAYYAVAVALHDQHPGDVGCRTYAMSREGRLRFNASPHLLTDDSCTRAHFGASEVVPGDTATSVTFAPSEHFGSAAGIDAQSTQNRGTTRSVSRALDPEDGEHAASTSGGCLATRQSVVSHAHPRRLAVGRQKPSEDTPEQLRHTQLTAGRLLPVPRILRPYGRLGNAVARAGALTHGPDEDKDTKASFDVTGHLGQTAMVGNQLALLTPGMTSPQETYCGPRSHEKVLS